MSEVRDPELLVFTTLPDADRARAFVRTLVEERIVACGTVLGDVISIYRWQGAIEESPEERTHWALVYGFR